MRTRSESTLLLTVAAVASLSLWNCGGEKGEDGPYVCIPPIQNRPVPADVDTTFPVGPVMMHVTESSAAVMWETETECTGELSYALSGQPLDRTVGSEKQRLIHKALLSGLEPDALYDYRVSACGHETAVLSFWTAPPKGSPVRFAVWGDSRTYPDRCALTVLAMAEQGPYFTLHVGDVVTDGENEPEWRDEFFEPLRGLGHYVPTYVAIGNHESNAGFFYDYVDYPYADSLSDHRQFGSNYSYTYGNVFILVVDTNNFFFHLAAIGEQSPLSEWIMEQVTSEAARRSTWRLASAHHPGYSECSGEGTPAIARWFLPLMAEHGFHVYFSGHTHAYERGEIDGVLHVISGGGGANLDRSCDDLPEIGLSVSEFQYVLVEADCDRMTLTSIQVPDATVIDEVVILASP